MKQERFMVIDNQKGVIIPLQEENGLIMDDIRKVKTDTNVTIEDKADKIHRLIKLMVKQSIRDTIREYNVVLKKELKLYEEEELRRWEKLEEAELNRWKNFEEQNLKNWELLQEKENKRLDQMEKHFKNLDQNIRKKQGEGKRKKHSIF